MVEEESCDICGRPGTKTQTEQHHDRLLIEIDQDGLRICTACRKRLITKPLSQESALELDDELKKLVGKSAGAICRTLELPYIPPYDSVIEAASTIAYDRDLYMSTWLFVSQWLDGTTVWRLPEGNIKAFVTSDGQVRIQNLNT